MPRLAPSDTVPAMLSPGEAVLNKEAAEMMGRDKIAAMNHAGVQRRKGIVPLEGYACGTSKVQGYADGTEEVTSYSAPPPQTAANLITSDASRQAAARDFQSRTGYMPGSIATSGATVSSAPNPVRTSQPKPSTELGVERPDFSTGATKLGNTDVYKSGNSYSDKGNYGSVKTPTGNKVNAYTGLTDLKGGDNAQAKANMFARTAPVAGMAPMATGIMKQFNLDTKKALPEIGARLGGGDQFAKPVQEQMPADEDLLNLPGEYQVQGFADGTEYVKPKFGDVPDLKNKLLEAKYADMAAKEPTPAHGFTGDPKAIAKYETPLAEPVTGPYSKVPPRPTIEAGKNLAPVARKGIVPVGGRAYTQPEPTPQQFRPGAGGAPEGAYKPNFTIDKETAPMRQLPAPAAPKAQGYSAEELANMERMKAAGRARVATARMGLGAGQAEAPATATPTAKAPVSTGGFVSKALGTAGAALGAAQTFSEPSAMDALIAAKAAKGDTKAMEIQARGGINPILSSIKSQVAKPGEYLAEKASPVTQHLTGENLKNYVSAAGQQMFGGGYAPKTDAKEAAPQTQTPAERTAFQKEMGQFTGEGNQGDLAIEAATKRPGGLKVGPPEQFEPKAVGDQLRVDLDDKGQFIQSGDKAAMERVAKGLRERGGIVGAAQRPAGGTSDFWTNRGYPGGAQQWKQEQEQQALQNIAINGGGRGDMTLSEYRRANAQQKIAQEILAGRERAAVDREQIGANKEAAQASLMSANAKEQIAQRRHADDMAQKKLDREQAAEIAGDKPVKIGEDIVATRDVPAYQANKARQEKLSTLTDYVKNNSGLLTSREEALTKGLIEAGDQEGSELAELQAYLGVAKSPEQKKQIEAEISNRLKPYRSILND